VGVFCVDRSGELLFGASGRLWPLLGQVLLALAADRVEQAWTVDGYVPSWLARSWGDLLFADLGEVVVVCRPVPGRPPGSSDALRPVGVYRRGAATEAAWHRAGEHLSVYDTPLATVLLRLAGVCTAGGGFAVTTLRPPAPGTPRSAVAVRSVLRRSGLLGRSAGARPGRPGDRRVVLPAREGRR
jgi:hypothetical protein